MYAKIVDIRIKWINYTVIKMKGIMMKRLLILTLLLTTHFSVFAATQDLPTEVKSEVSNKFEEAIAPEILKAQQNLAEVKRRFLNGLKKDNKLYLTIRIADQYGNVEQVYIRTYLWKDSTVMGQISNNLYSVSGYRPGQTISFDESDILDWTLIDADGKEYGNYLGRFAVKWLESNKKTSLTNKESK